MIRRPPRSTRTDTLFPYTTLFRSAAMTAPPAAVLPPEPPNAILAGLACRCPRCGKGRLFSGILKIAERCNACGLDLRKQDAGDGTAVRTEERSVGKECVSTG